MTTLRERQLHMAQLLKKLDRMIAEKHGKFNVPFYHYQKPLAGPGERESVCVHLDALKREFLPYGIELEKMVEDARLWVRTGEGPRPEVMIEKEIVRLSREEETAEARVPSAMMHRKLAGTREALASGETKRRVRPPS